MRTLSISIKTIFAFAEKQTRISLVYILMHRLLNVFFPLSVCLKLAILWKPCLLAKYFYPNKHNMNLTIFPNKGILKT